MKKHFIALLILVLLTGLLPACSGDQSEADADEPLIGWDYFESFNPIGDTYSNIQSSHRSFEEEGNYDGGIVLKVDDNDQLFFGFPRYSMSMIEPDDQCTSVYGTLETVFGIDYYIGVSEFVEMLDITLNQDYDSQYCAMKTADSGTYMIRIELENVEDDISPETSVAIFQNDEMAGAGYQE